MRSLRRPDWFVLVVAASTCFASPSVAQSGAYRVFAEAVAGGEQATNTSSVFERETNDLVDGPTMTTADASISYAVPGTDFVETASAFSSADLASGRVRADGSGNYTSDPNVFGIGFARAIFEDTLFFTIPGASSETITPLTLLFESRGDVSPSPSGSWVYRIDGNFDVVGGRSSSFRGYVEDGVVTTSEGGWSNFTFSHASPGYVAGYGTLDLIGSAPSVWLAFDLAAYGLGGTGIDSTAGLRLGLPPGATFRSASGAFLSQNNAIPEPSTWGMLILGFGLIGAIMRASHRRRQRAASAA